MDNESPSVLIKRSILLWKHSGSLRDYCHQTIAGAPKIALEHEHGVGLFREVKITASCRERISPSVSANRCLFIKHTHKTSSLFSEFSSQSLSVFSSHFPLWTIQQWNNGSEPACLSHIDFFVHIAYLLTFNYPTNSTQNLWQNYTN